MSNPDEDRILPSTSQESFPPLLDALRGIIADSRRQVLRAVDTVQVQTYWQIGRHIVEYEQGGEARAEEGRAQHATLTTCAPGRRGARCGEVGVDPTCKSSG